MSEDEYAVFCLLQKENLSKADREKVKAMTEFTREYGVY